MITILQQNKLHYYEEIIAKQIHITT